MSSPCFHGAESSYITLRGLRHRVLSWKPPGSAQRSGDSPGPLSSSETDSRAPRATVLLLHGWADAAGSWQWVAPRLAQAGFEVVAPDLRGFGESEWISAQSYYHFPDYVADVAALVGSLQPKRLVVVGHSMGGTVASLYAGAQPERVHQLALLEGVGPPSSEPADAVERMRAWLHDLDRSVRRSTERTFATAEEVLKRLQTQHPSVSHTTLAACVDVLACKGEDQRWRWRFDPLHRTTSPFPFLAESYRSFARKIRCPTLFLSGGADGYHPVDEAERLAAFANVQSVSIEGAGHMMHWTAPEAVAKALIHFLSSSEREDSPRSLEVACQELTPAIEPPEADGA